MRILVYLIFTFDSSFTSYNCILIYKKAVPKLAAIDTRYYNPSLWLQPPPNRLHLNPTRADSVEEKKCAHRN